MARPFRGLRDRPPRAEYDAVVVGAGVGGLVCANLLAREGLRVLLAEQHYMVGGYCSTFRRAGCTFDASTHFYPLLGNADTLTGQLLRDLGARTEWIAMDPVDTFHLPDGTRFEVPADLPSYRRALDERFPQSQSQLERFFTEAREAYLLGTLYHFRGRRTRKLAAYEDLTLDQVLRRHFEDERLRLLLTADVPHWGSPPDRTSFVFDSMLRLSYFLGNYYPRGGSQAFVDDLAARFEERRGEIAMSTAVERILVQEGRVAGVVLHTTRGRQKGRFEARAPIVVSNADLLHTLRDLLPDAPAVEAERRQLARLRPSFPCFLTHIALQGADPDALEQIQGYYWQEWDANRVGRGALRLKVFCPTHYDPELAPPDHQILILQKVLEIDPRELRDPAEHKQQIEAYLLAELEKILPGISSHIVTVLTASAHTAERFTRNERGGMLGWEMSPDQLGDHRPSGEGPIPGLFRVGHWVRPGGGITPVIVSALQAAQGITKGSILES